MTERAASLHLRILGYLVVPLALMAAVLMFEVYASANRSTGQVQDQMLLSYALGISEHAVSTGGDLVYIDLIQQTTSGTVFYWVEGPDNAFVSGYSGLRNITDPSALNDREPRFFDGRHRDRDVRVVALRSLVEGRDLEGWMTVYVAQPTAARRELVWSQIANSALRLSLLIVVAGVLGWVAVSRGLKPLARLERAIGSRSSEDLRPIELRLPRETTHVVAALNALLARLASSISRNKRFIANASHQLRTPVASLMAQTELALRGSADAQTRSSLEGIHSVVKHMARLISQLLTLAQADGIDRTQSQFEPLDLVAVAKSITAEQVPEAVRRDIDLGFDTDLASASIEGNRIMLGELLQNLLENACHYCPAGSVVTVKVTADGEHATLRVEDDGPGISINQRAHATERFTRLCEGDVADGSGLGLAIAKEVAELHGGRLRLDAGSGGKGLTVRIEFPLLTGQSARSPSAVAIA